MAAVVQPATKRRVKLGLSIALVALAAVGFRNWRVATKNGGQEYATPFRIAGNLYYVGASDIAAFLITGPEGHILLDGGYPGTPKLILASIAELGFDIRDVKVLINSEPHYDHAGGLAELQDSSGAQLWLSGPSADVIGSGGLNDASVTFLPMKLLVASGLLRYPRARVDHRFNDGDTIRVGPIALTAHITAGHTPGCTTWTFQVQDGERLLNVVSACSFTLLPGVSFVEPERYPGIRADFERSIRVMRELPVDIWVTSHAREFGRYRKFVARDTAADSVAPFIDREGYAQYIRTAEERFQKRLAEQQQR